MRITNLRVQRYKSLYDVDLEFLPLMALFGPNGAGKTNFVDALSFLGIAFAQGLESAVNAKGGPDRIVFRGLSGESDPVSISVTVRAAVDELRSPRPGFQAYLQRTADEGRELPDLELVYGFGISSHGHDGLRDFAVAFEEIEIRHGHDSDMRPVLTVSRIGNAVQPRVSEPGSIDLDLWNELAFPFSDHSFVEAFEGANRGDQLLVAPLSLFNPVIAWLTGSLGRLQTFAIIPAAGRLPGMPSSIGQLDGTGANLPTEVKTVQEHFPAVWERVMERMQELEPRFSKIGASLTSERRLVLQFDEGDSVQSWRATEVSDGTIRMLAMLTALYDPRFSIVAIEEPENSLNAWAVRAFVNACREVVDAGGKHVLLTSHSPAAINFLRPEEVLVVWRDQSGHTNVKPLVALDPDIQRLWESGTAFLFDLLDSGLVREAVPGVFA